MAEAHDLPIRLPASWQGCLNLYHEPRAKHDWHRHSASWELNLVVAGHGRYATGAGPVDLVRGSLIAFPPDQPHQLTAVSPGLSLWVVGLRAAWVGSCLGMAPGRPPPRTIAAGEAEELARLCAQVHACADHPATLNAGLAFLLLAAWRALQREAPAAGVRHPAVQAALRRLRAQPGLGVAALAKEGGLGRQRLSALFHAEVGTTLSAWRSRQRLDQALALAHAGRPMAEAARRAGFGSYAQFHRVFRRVLGQSPREWLNTHATRHLAP